MKDEHVHSLDGVRGFAALLVLFGHTSGELGASWLTPSVVAAKSGVYLFFVLSSFLLTRQFLRADLTSATTVPFLSEFFRRRVLRILPLYYIAIMAYYAVSFAVPGKGCVIHDARAVFKSLLLNGGYGHFWTIPIEFIYYFILPAVALIAVGAARKWHALLVYAAFVVASIVLFRSSDYGVAPVAYIFICGSMLAVMDEYRHVLSSRVVQFAAACGACVAVTAFFATLPLLRDRGYSYSDVENMRVWWTAIACLVMAGCLWGSAWFRAAFESPVLRFLGAISFSAYVWHILVYAATKNVCGGFEPSTKHVIAWVCVLLCGWASYRFLEMPIYRSARAKRAWDNAVNRWLPRASSTA